MCETNGGQIKEQDVPLPAGMFATWKIFKKSTMIGIKFLATLMRPQSYAKLNEWVANGVASDTHDFITQYIYVAQPPSRNQTSRW